MTNGQKTEKPTLHRYSIEDHLHCVLAGVWWHEHGLVKVIAKFLS